MTKHWDGPTPWDLIERGTNRISYSVEGRARAEAYREAMNSPVVTTLYKVLKSLKMASGKGVADTLPDALAAYEAGLKEDKNR